MRVYIGPFKHWFGPFQFADWLTYLPQKWGWMTDDQGYEFGEFLSETWVGDFLVWVDSKKNRKIKIHIDGFDAWSAHNTMSMIIHPILLKLKEHKQGAPFVDDEDVPEHLRSTAAPKPELEYDTDENHFKRWDWVLDEMIYDFECDNNEDWEDQFYTGETDFHFKPVEGSTNSTLETGPKHTMVWNREAEEKAWERRNNGRRLFAKYYRNLWN